MEDGWSVADDEFITATDPFGKTVSDDGTTLRQLSESEKLAAAKRSKEEEITAARQAKLTALQVRVGGVFYDADELSTQRMTGALSMWERAAATGDPRAPSTIAWLDANNRSRGLTLLQLGEVAAAAWLAQQTVWAVSNGAKENVAVAMTIEEVESVRARF